MMSKNGGPKGARNGTKGAPLLQQLERVAPRELKAKVRSSRHELIGRYVDYFQKATGTKPEEGEVWTGRWCGCSNRTGGFRDS